MQEQEPVSEGQVGGIGGIGPDRQGRRRRKDRSIKVRRRRKGEEMLGGGKDGK